MDLYFNPQCGPSKRVLFTLGELGIPVDRHALDLQKGEHKSASYLAVNPLGKVPTLVDGDRVLWESSAIILYLAERHPERGLLPTSVDERAELNKWLFFLAYEVAWPMFRFWFQSRAVATGQPADLQERDSSRARVEMALPVIEKQLADRDYLLGAFSLADIAFAPTLSQLAAGQLDLSAFPNIQGWIGRVLARPAWRALSEPTTSMRLAG